MSKFLCCFRRGKTALFSTLPQWAKKEKKQMQTIFSGVKDAIFSQLFPHKHGKIRYTVSRKTKLRFA
jgi:hypothetical protein